MSAEKDLVQLKYEQTKRNEKWSGRYTRLTAARCKHSDRVILSMTILVPQLIYPLNNMHFSCQTMS